jgi:hypothetical protein
MPDRPANPVEILHMVGLTLNTDPPVRLHCGVAILEYLRHALPGGRRDITGQIDPAAAILGIPIVLDDTLHSGQYQLRTDAGDVVKSGQVGDPERVTAYVPGIGFVSIDPAALDPGPLEPPRLSPPTRRIRLDGDLTS